MEFRRSSRLGWGIRGAMKRPSEATDGTFCKFKNIAFGALLKEDVLLGISF